MYTGFLDESEADLVYFFIHLLCGCYKFYPYVFKTYSACIPHGYIIVSLSSGSYAEIDFLIMENPMQPSCMGSIMGFLVIYGKATLIR